MTGKLRWELVSWAGFHRLSRQLAMKVLDSGYRPDLIVAIARGGYMPARVLSDYLDLMDITSFKIEHYRGAHKQPTAIIRYPLPAAIDGRRVLLVDDVSDSGDTFTVALEHLRQHGEPREVRTAVMDHKVVSRYVPDYYARRIVKYRWIVYPWAVMEDFTGLIAAMEPRPPDLEALAARIQREHGARVPRQVLADAIAVLDRDQ